MSKKPWMAIFGVSALVVIGVSCTETDSGHLLVGRAHGQPIRVTLLYPAEMADAYWPSVRTILDSLELDAELLPVTTSG